MPTQNIDLGNTDDVQFDSQQVDEMYLDGALIWKRATPNTNHVISITAVAPDPNNASQYYLQVSMGPPPHSHAYWKFSHNNNIITVNSGFVGHFTPAAAGVQNTLVAGSYDASGVQLAQSAPYTFTIGSSGGGGGTTPVLGCTDPAATNYDPNATQDDGSCTYAPGIVDIWVPWPAYPALGNLSTLGPLSRCPTWPNGQGSSPCPGHILPAVSGGSAVTYDPTTGAPVETFFLAENVDVNYSQVPGQPGTTGQNVMFVSSDIDLANAGHRSLHNLTTAGIYSSPDKKNYKITKVEPQAATVGNPTSGWTWSSKYGANPGHGGSAQAHLGIEVEEFNEFLPGGTVWEIRTGSGYSTGGGTLQGTVTFFYHRLDASQPKCRVTLANGTTHDSNWVFHDGVSSMCGSSLCPASISWTPYTTGVQSNMINPGGTGLWVGMYTAAAGTHLTGSFEGAGAGFTRIA